MGKGFSHFECLDMENNTVKGNGVTACYRLSSHGLNTYNVLETGSASVIS